MAAQRYNDDALVRTHELELVRDDKGLWSGSQIYYCAADRLSTLMPARGSAHPEYSWLTAEGARVTGEEGGWMKIQVDYTGMLGSGTGDDEDDNPPTYTMSLALSEEPLESHPRYDTLTDDDVQDAVTLAKNPATDADGKPVPADTTGWAVLKVELYDRIRRGFDSFRDPKVTWRKDWVSNTRPSNLNDVGNIATPGGSPPSPASGRNWLSAGLESRERGGVFENSETFELSGRGGWNEDIYA